MRLCQSFIGAFMIVPSNWLYCNLSVILNNLHLQDYECCAPRIVLDKHFLVCYDMLNLEVYIVKAHERIKDLRKNILHLSQKDFAEQINISRSNLGNIETNKINLTERVLMDICRTFHVNQEWLSNGTEPIFVEDPHFLDDQIVSLLYRLTIWSSRK